MDLIDKGAAIEAMKKWATQPVIMKSRYFDPRGKAIVLDMIGTVEGQPTIDAVPIDPLAVWLAGYHVSPPEYALKETGALDPIDPASTVFTPNQIATAWAYHLRKLMESGLMG